uniref:RING-type domain-containing protein n=1 Tax=Trypanosoma vivax (strain Y486) TaxID=1055687 RepID=G0TXQ7_TRYVY|nr:conserved hypothetical protein, fragment [Trypanosoma vivax Y486]
MSSALSGDVVPPKRGVRKRQREPVEDEVDCMADDVHVSFAARISSDPSRGGLVKPSGRDAGYMWDADASCREQAEAAWEGMGKEKRLLFLVEHLKYYMRYAVQKHLFPSSVRFASDVTEISREHTAESALLLQFHVSIPCVFRFVISEWQRVADMEATGMLGPSDHRFDTGNFVRSCLAHMRTVDGLTALLFISCPACRTIYLSDDALSVLLGILLEFGHLCPDDLLGGRSMETMLEALSKIDKRLYSASDHACAYSETHRQLMLLISHTKADVRELWKGFDVSLFPVFSSALQGESAAYVCKKNGQGNEVTRESMIPAQDTTQIPGTPCEECVQSQKCRSPDSNRFGFSDCGGLDHTTSIFTDCHRFSMLEREVRAHETVWSEDSCKLEVVLHAPVQHCIAPSQPTTQLKLRELMGAFFILHRAVSEQAQRRGFVLESLESRIVALYNESLVSGLIPSASTFSTADRACSVALGDDSMVEPEHLARRENVAARGTFRENLSIQELMPENMCPAAVLSGVAAYSTKHLADLARATESFFPREYIKAQLKPHQLESLAYMLAREKRGMAKYVEVPCDTLTSDDLKPHNRSINRQRSTSQRGRTCVSMFYSSMMATCFVVRSDSVSATRARQKARCGFLCDEMGLGKTLVILSLCAAGRKRKGQDGITAPRRPLPYYRAKVGSFRKAYTNGLEGRAVTSTVNSCSGEIIDVSSSSDTASDDGSDLEEVWSNPDTIEHHRSLVIDRTVNWNLILGSGPREGPPRLPRLPDLKPLPNTTLITVPYSLLPQWVSEIDRFYPSARYIVFHGPARFRYTSDDFMSADFVITTYETLTAHLREETDGVFCLFSHLAPRDTTRFVALKEWDALNAAGCCRGKAKRASSSLASSEASSALQNIVDRSFRQVVGCMERTNLTSRTKKIPSLMQTIQLTPLKEACVPVPLSESERFLYNHVSGIIQGEVARLQRQGLLANRMMKVLAWVRLMTSVALHPSTVFAELNNGAPSLLPRHREKLVEFDPSFSESFVSVSASEALDWALEHHVEVEEHVSGASPTSVVPEATLEVLRKLSRTPSELPNCPICLDTMLKPTLLSCFHIFCKECVAELAQAAWSSKGTENVAYCPFCRCGTSLRQRKRVIDVDVGRTRWLARPRRRTCFLLTFARPAVSDDVLREHLTSVAKGSRVSRLAQLLKEIWQKHPNDSVLVFSKVPSVLQPGAQAVKKTVDASVHVIDNYLTLGKRKKIFAELHSSKQRTGAGSLSDSETSCLSGGSRMVVFLSSHVASVGLNLTFANHLIFMEANINPTLQQQAIGRINCFGQKKEIHVYFMYAPGTIEEKILKRNSTILQDETQSTAAGNRIDRAETGEKGRMGQQLTERSDEACQLELCSLLMP